MIAVRAPHRPARRRTPLKEKTMGLDDKAKNKAEELKGKGKQAAGEATDDEELQAEGKADETKGNLKQAGEKIKDVFK
jgi:uncharacterized protein YjbJ (UPF0337 family)